MTKDLKCIHRAGCVYISACRDAGHCTSTTHTKSEATSSNPSAVLKTMRDMLHVAQRSGGLVTLTVENCKEVIRELEQVPVETTTALTARCDKHVPTHGHGDTRCARELHHTGSHICPVSIASAQCRWAWTELQGLPVEPTGTYTNEAPAHPPIMPKRFNSTSTPENGN